MLRRKRPTEDLRLDMVDRVASTFQFEDFDLADAICSLSEPMREAFLLVKGEGLTHREAAEAVGVPVGTMYFRVHSAVRQLRALLSSTVGEGIEKVTCTHEV
jgi:RNA polymerase sigma-70 factor (ECF subfamily)